MKNAEFVIHLELKSGKRQTFQKDDKGWYEISTRGNRFDCTAEQVLNHLLPALLKNYKDVEVIVEKKLD